MTAATQRGQAPAQTATTSPENEELLDRMIDATVARMDSVAQRYAAELDDPLIGRLRKAALMGAAVQKLRAMFTPALLGILRALSNSPLGFMCDRPNKSNEKPYPDEVLRDCAIEALLKGFWWTGNEFNVISGRMMGVQAGWKRKCEEIPGITDLKVTPGFPGVSGGQVGVRVAASWKIDGQPDCLVNTEGTPGRVFLIPQNAGSTADNSIGKALRRAYKAIYEQATGTRVSELDEEPVSAEGAVQTHPKQSRTEALAAKLGNGSPPVDASATVEPAGPAELPREPGVEPPEEGDQAASPEAPPALEAAEEIERERQRTEIRKEMQAVCIAKGAKKDDLREVGAKVMKFEDDWGLEAARPLREEYQERYQRLPAEAPAKVARKGY